MTDGVVVDLSQRAAQKILGAYYASGKIPTRFRGSLELPGGDSTTIQLELFLDRPRLEFEFGHMNETGVHLLFVGEVSCTGGPWDGQRHWVRIQAQARMPLRVQPLEGRSVQIAADHTAAALQIIKVRSHSGPLPSVLGRALVGPNVTAKIQQWLAQGSGEPSATVRPWRLTPELFDRLPSDGELEDAVSIWASAGKLRIGLRVNGADPHDPLAEIAAVMPGLSTGTDMVLRGSGNLVYGRFASNRDELIKEARRHHLVIRDLDMRMMPVGILYYGTVSEGRFEVRVVPVVDRTSDALRYAATAELDMPWWVDLVHFVGKVLSWTTGPFGLMYGRSIDMMLDSVRASAEGSLDEVMRRTAQRISLGTLPSCNGARVVTSIEALRNGLLPINGQRTELVSCSLSIAGGEIVGPTYTSPDAPSSTSRTYRFEPAHGLVHPEERRVRVRWDWIRKGKPTLRTEHPLQPGAANTWSRPASVQDSGWSTLEVAVYRDETNGTRQILSRAKKRLHFGKRLATNKRYVRWGHAGMRARARGRVVIGAEQEVEPVWDGEEAFRRTSKIHKTDPTKRCADADQFSGACRPVDVDYFDVLPEEPDALCRACFPERS